MSRRHLLVLGAANLAPLAGFVFLEWSPTVVLGVIVLDVWTTVFWALCTLPFAEKRPSTLSQIDGRVLGPLGEKRGGLTVSSRLPPIYVRNATMLLPWALFGGVLVVLSVVLVSLPSPELSGEVMGWILAGGLFAFLVRGVDTWREFFREGGYRDHSARTIVLEPFQQLVAVGTLVVGIVIVARVVGDGGPPVIDEFALVSVVFLGKFVADIRAWHIQLEPDRRGVFTLFYGSPDTEHPAESVTVPDEEPTLRVRPSKAAVTIDSLVRGFCYLCSGWGLLVAVSLGIGLAGGSSPFVAVGIAGASAIVAVRAAVRYLEIGTLEYRCYDSVIVAHDRVLDEPQARLERWAITDLSPSDGPAERLLETDSVTLETTYEPPEPSGLVVGPDELPTPDPDANRSLTLAHVPEWESVLEAVGADHLASRRSALAER